MATQTDSQLDVTGSCCPLPIMLLAKAVNRLSHGQTIEITGNDPIFEPSIRDFCKTNGHAVLEVKLDEKHIVSIIIRVS